METISAMTYRRITIAESNRDDVLPEKPDTISHPRTLQRAYLSHAPTKLMAANVIISLLTVGAISE